MASGDVSLIYCFNGTLIDEHNNATYINETTKGSTVPKSISFATFKEKVQELTNLPSNGMEIKIKCGVMDHTKFTLTATEVDDDDSLRLVMDRSKFIMAYICLEHVQPATSSTATQWQEVQRPDDHYQAMGVISGAEVNCQEDAHNGVDAFPVHVLSQPHFGAGDGQFNLQMGNQNDLMISENQNWEGLNPNMFPLPHVGHLDKGINSSICDREDINFRDASNEQGADHLEVPATSQIQTSAGEPAHLLSSDFGIDLEREFPNIDTLRNAITDMTIRMRREYVCVRTSPCELILKCKDYRCKWYVKAARLENSHAFKVKTYRKNHICAVCTISGEKDEDHPNATKKWIASKVQSIIERNPDMGPKKIVNEIKDKFGIKISADKAMKAKNEVKDRIRKRMKALPAPDAQVCRWLVEELKRGGSVADLGLNPVNGSFEYLFWAFSACIHALHTHLRPVLYVRTEDIALGVLMCAYGVDGNSYFKYCGSFVDVGFAVFGRENEEAWETFMRCLKDYVLPATDNNNNFPFAIVTDLKNAGICAAIERVLLPDIHHFFFRPDFVRVISEKFKVSPSICKDACLVFSAETCDEYLEDIKSMNEEAHEWLLQKRKSKWSVAFSPNKHVSHTDRETVRYMFILEKLAIVEIVESSREMVANYFSERRMIGEEAAKTTSTTGLTRRLLDDMRRVPHLYEVPQLINGGPKYQVLTNSICRLDGVVDLEEKSCTCGEFQEQEYPCDHALKVIAHLDLDLRNYYNHQWYSLDAYCATYSQSLPPPITGHISQSQPAATGVPYYPAKQKKLGRPYKLQRKG